MKNKVWLSILLFTSLLLTNCQDETLELQETKSSYKFNYIGKIEIQENNALRNKLEIMKKEFTKRKNNKSVYSELYNFTIQTDYAFYVASENGLQHSYTFPITRDEDNGLTETFMLTLKDNGNYVAHYTSYDLTEQEKVYNGNNDYLDITDKVTTVEITDEYLIFEVLENKDPKPDQTVVGHWELYTEWDPVWHTYTSTWVWVIDYIFDGIPDNADGSDSNVGDENDYNCCGSSNTPNNGNTGSNSTTSTPILVNLPLIVQINSLTGQSLTPEENLWVSDPENADFVALAIEVLENGGEVDFEEFIRIIDQMNKRCQAKIVADALYLESTFTNMFFNSLIESTDNHILFFDLPSGNGENQVSENVGAETTLIPVTIEGVSGQSMVINFNNDYLDTATDLSIFTTTIHEMLHAYLYNLYDNNLLLSTYPQYTALNDAITNLIQNDSNVNQQNFDLEAHNVYIDFIDLMAQSIFQYAQNNNIDDVDFEYAKNLVWGGLFDPNNNDNIFTNNLTQEEQLEVKTIVINEHTNHPNAKGTKNCIND